MTEKVKIFCKEYIVDFNATQAAIRSGYSKKTAGSIGQENLTKPEIQKEIQKLIDERSNRTQITADKVLQELAKIGFSDILDFVEVSTTGITFNDIPEGKGGVISEVSSSDTKYGTNIKIKLHDKLNALDKIARYLGGFYKDKEAPEDPGSDRITEIRKTVVYKPKDDA